MQFFFFLISIYYSASDFLTGVYQALRCLVYLCLVGVVCLLHPPVFLHFSHSHTLSVFWNQLAFSSFESLLRLYWAFPLIQMTGSISAFRSQLMCNLLQEAFPAPSALRRSHPSFCSFSLSHTQFIYMYFFAYSPKVCFPTTP